MRIVSSFIPLGDNDKMAEKSLKRVTFIRHLQIVLVSFYYGDIFFIFVRLQVIEDSKSHIMTTQSENSLEQG